MSATEDVKAYLEKMTPQEGETLEMFAIRGLAWQTEIYSANAGCDIPGLSWYDIAESSRKGWLDWARTKFEAAGIPVPKE